MLLLKYAIATVLLVLYNSWLADKPANRFVAAGLLFRSFSNFMFSSMVRPNLAKDKADSIFLVNSICFIPVWSAYLIRPTYMVFVKCIPHSIAEVMLGLIITIIKLNSELLMRLFALWLVSGYDIRICEEEGDEKVCHYEGLSAAIK